MEFKEGFPSTEEHNTTEEILLDNKEGLEDILKERNIDLSSEQASSGKEFSLAERERVYNSAQEQLKNSRERFRQQETFVTQEQIDEVFKGNLEEVEKSINSMETEARIEALKEKTILSPEALDAALEGIERARLAPSQAQIVNNMERVYKAYENRPRRNVNVTSKPTVR